jgi:hypothetical protein
MPIDFTFRSIDRKNLDDLIKFIQENNPGYPNYYPWTEKTRGEINSGTKYGYALYYYGSIAGDIIFQQHKQIKEIIELKNVRIHSKLKGRKCATFMVGQVEFEMPWKAIITDVKLIQTDMINFLISQGYSPIAQTFLYDSHNPDVVLIKLNKQEKKESILQIVKSTLKLNENPKTLIYPSRELA